MDNKVQEILAISILVAVLCTLINPLILLTFITILFLYVLFEPKFAVKAQELLYSLSERILNLHLFEAIQRNRLIARYGFYRLIFATGCDSKGNLVYGHLSKRRRKTYLNWMAGGRTDPNVSIGCVFLFFYRLEQKLLIDGQRKSITTKEREAIIREIRILLHIYGGNEVFCRYAQALLHMEWILYQRDTDDIPSYLDFKGEYCLNTFQVVLAKYSNSKTPLSTDMALLWVKLRLEPTLKIGGSDYGDVDKSKFDRLYHKNYGEGLIIRPTIIPLEVRYRTANPVFKRDLVFKIADLTNSFMLISPIEKITSLVKECINGQATIENIANLLFVRFRLDKDEMREYKPEPQSFEEFFPEKEDTTKKQIVPSKTQPSPVSFSSPATKRPEAPRKFKPDKDEIRDYKTKPQSFEQFFPKKEAETKRQAGPSKIQSTPAFKLNKEKIRYYEEKTERARDILASVFLDQEEEIIKNDMQNLDTPLTESSNALDKNHQDLLDRLIQQETWEINAYQQLCKELDLLPNGAIEKINEWSYEEIDEPVIEEGDTILINIDLIKEIINGN